MIKISLFWLHLLNAHLKYLDVRQKNKSKGRTSKILMTTMSMKEYNSLIKHNFMNIMTHNNQISFQVAELNLKKRSKYGKAITSIQSIRTFPIIIYNVPEKNFRIHINVMIQISFLDTVTESAISFFNMLMQKR